jgi:hypothetical protein
MILDLRSRGEFETGVLPRPSGRAPTGHLFGYQHNCIYIQPLDAPSDRHASGSQRLAGGKLGFEFEATQP